jgi:hypothetical protein
VPRKKRRFSLRRLVQRLKLSVAESFDFGAFRSATVPVGYYRLPVKQVGCRAIVPKPIPPSILPQPQVDTPAETIRISAPGFEAVITPAKCSPWIGEIIDSLRQRGATVLPQTIPSETRFDLPSSLEDSASN